MLTLRLTLFPHFTVIISSTFVGWFFSVWWIMGSWIMGSDPMIQDPHDSSEKTKAKCGSWGDPMIHDSSFCWGSDMPGSMACVRITTECASAATNVAKISRICTDFCLYAVQRDLVHRIRHILRNNSTLFLVNCTDFGLFHPLCGGTTLYIRS